MRRVLPFLMSTATGPAGGDASQVRLPAGAVTLDGTLEGVPGALGLVLFAHGSGSSRFSPRNRAVAAALRRGGLATFLFDLLTPDEEALDERTRALRFDVPMLADRLVAAARWLRQRPGTAELPFGYFGASTGAAAALVAAAAAPDLVGAVVSRGGRPDLAGADLPRVAAPTLLIVGSSDTTVLELNRQSMGMLRAPTTLEVVPGAGHLFEEPGTLERVAELARDWFVRHLG
jgi:putative phosphoribosyl transferase